MTRMRIGVASAAPRAVSARWRVVQSMTMFPWRSISAVEAGRDDRRRVVLLDDRRPGDPVAGPQALALVERRRVALAPAVDVEDDLALERQRPRRVAVAGLELAAAAARRRGRCRPTRTLMISIGGVEALAVLGLVRRVEALRELLDPGVVDVPGGHVDAHLVALAGVAAVGEAADEPAIVGHAVRVELGDGLPAELGEAAPRVASGRASSTGAARSRRTRAAGRWRAGRSPR